MKLAYYALICTTLTIVFWMGGFSSDFGDSWINEKILQGNSTSGDIGAGMSNYESSFLMELIKSLFVAAAAGVIIGSVMGINMTYAIKGGLIMTPLVSMAMVLTKVYGYFHDAGVNSWVYWVGTLLFGALIVGYLFALVSYWENAS